jgi:hypothetical protein
MTEPVGCPEAAAPSSLYRVTSRIRELSKIDT